jgi:leukotriene-A4 hydrolase
MKLLDLSPLSSLFSLSPQSSPSSLSAAGIALLACLPWLALLLACAQQPRATGPQAPAPTGGAAVRSAKTGSPGAAAAPQQGPAGTATGQPAAGAPGQPPAAAPGQPPAAPPQARSAAPDVHSFSRPDEVAVDHLQLALTVDFATRRLTGRASLRLVNPRGAGRLLLDTRDLDIQKVTLDDGRTPAPFTLGDPVPFLGRALEIRIPPSARTVHVDYATRPEAGALQWVTPEQAGSAHPFLYTQSEAILARTWVPCQDTPGVRMTYDATVRVPPGLLAVMSAENPTAPSADGVYRFHMPQRIPSYLLALAVGDLVFRPFDARSGVYALPPVAERAAWELAGTPQMIAAAERLFGRYPWGRYDLLVLPASYPYGGMENPRLTFATPTILAGDRSLVSLVAHELAHSWSGNLVTNAGWNDFWLNEGFTVYCERRIMEATSGRDYAAMLAVLGRQELEDHIAELGAESPDTRLLLDLAGRDPDEGTSIVAYEKGALLLSTIEASVGRERFDAFLRSYFSAFAFQSMDTRRFLAYLRAHLLDASPGLAESLRLDDWVYGPGIPPTAIVPRSTAFAEVDRAAADFARGTAAGDLRTAAWNTQQWLRFLRRLPSPLPAARLGELDAAFHLTAAGNSEILHSWLMLAVQNRYAPAYPALETFLMRVGRRKFIKPLYTELFKTPAGAEMALRIYGQARPRYHPLAQSTIDKILDWRG